jgi:hypothetical protein
MTEVSGGDFTHICDPFWPCTGTYCCQCAGFVPLDEVRWEDTDELITRFRRRLRKATPGLLKVWRYGLGLVPGGVVGAGFGLLTALAGRMPDKSVAGVTVLGGLVGALLIYVAGTMIFNSIFGIDYRRRR